MSNDKKNANDKKNVNDKKNANDLSQEGSIAKKKDFKSKIASWNWRPWAVGATIGIGALAVGVGIGLGIALPKAQEANRNLNKFISSGGPANSLKNKAKINYVALGDSETEGASLLLEGNYRSYADFLASSFKKAGRLNDNSDSLEATGYHNFAVSGQRLADINRDLFQRPDALRALKSADLITLTIGANDILAYFNMFNIPYTGSALSLIANVSNAVAKWSSASDSAKPAVEAEYPFLNDEWKNWTQENLDDDLFKIYGQAGIIGTNEIGEKPSWQEPEDIFDQKPNFVSNKQDSQARFTESAKDIMKVMSGDGGAFFNLDQDWNEQIFEVIKNETALLIKKLHDVAPNAQIVMIGHLFPFAQMPDIVKNSPKPELKDNMTLLEAFNYLITSMKDGAMMTNDEPNDFVTFVDANELETVKNANQAHSKVDYNDKANFATSWKNNIMPNINDIHPSVYGHEQLAAGLFEILGKDAGLNDEQISANTQTSVDFDPTKYEAGSKNYLAQDPWARIDENPEIINALYDRQKGLYQLLNTPTLLNKPLTVSSAAKLLEPILTNISDQVDATTPEALTSEKIKDLFKQQLINEGIEAMSSLVEEERLIPLIDAIEKTSRDIVALTKFLNDNIKSLNEKQVLSYSMFGVAVSFADALKTILSLQDLAEFKPN